MTFDNYICASKNILMAQDLYQHPDYYQMDDLLTDEHKLIRDTVRAWIKKK